MFGSCPDWINYFEKENFIYLFILVAFVCLFGSWRWPCFRLVSFDLMLEFKFSSFILNERSGLFKIKCVGKNTPGLLLFQSFQEQHS